MSDLHFRNVIAQAKQRNSLQLLDKAFQFLEKDFDGFLGTKYSFENLVFFAETASLLGNREHYVERGLNLFRRLEVEPNQFTARMLLVRCTFESRRAHANKLKGDHMVQQVTFALGFLNDALDIALKAEVKERYGFLVYNASLVFWTVIRPVCRTGTQKLFVDHFKKMMEALTSLVPAKGGVGVGIPVTLSITWRAEFMIQYAFALEDAGRQPEG